MILCTFPGRAGDVLWALPTVRAISRFHGLPVDLVIAQQYAHVLPVIRQQTDYIRYAWADPAWKVEDTAPISPREPTRDFAIWGEPAVEYEHVFHLGYTGWPTHPLPLYTYQQALREIPELETTPYFDLAEPWISLPVSKVRVPVVVGFTDEWIELKAGVVLACWRAGPEASGILITHAPGSRWPEFFEEGADPWEHPKIEECSFTGAASRIQNCTVFLGCLSAMAVLARAMGKPTVLVEPEKMRHHPIFHDGIHPGLVLGNDGRPTFDARATVAALAAALGAAR